MTKSRISGRGSCGCLLFRAGIGGGVADVGDRCLGRMNISGDDDVKVRRGNLCADGPVQGVGQLVAGWATGC